MAPPDETLPIGPADAPTGRPGDPSWYTRRMEAAIYVVAAVTYIVFGIYNKWLLNWVIGPVWLVAWVWIAPQVIDRFRRPRAGAVQ